MRECPAVADFRGDGIALGDPHFNRIVNHNCSNRLRESAAHVVGGFQRRLFVALNVAVPELAVGVEHDSLRGRISLDGELMEEAHFCEDRCPFLGR